ncbi:IS110 family transposase [bacterium]|nr:IS110 family transposase [bacterium]
MREAKQIDFDGQNIYVGIDVHKKSWQVSIYTEQFEHKTFTQPPVSEKLVSYLQRVFPGGEYHAVYEAGFSGFWTHDELKDMGVDCMVVHPGDVPTTDKERRHKTDSRDSRKLAKQLRSGDLSAIHVPGVRLREDRSLLRQRKTIRKEETRVKNRIKQFLHFRGVDIPVHFSSSYWSGSFIKWLEEVSLYCETGTATLSSLLRQLASLRKELACLSRDIRELSRTAAYRDGVKYLSSISGIGVLSAMVWLTELGNIHRFNSFDQLCSYVGLVPWEHSSGESEYTVGLDRRGNKVLRTLLIENAWVAVKKDSELMLAYSQYIKRMKGQQAIVRIARKLLRRIRFVLVNEQNLE